MGTPKRRRPMIDRRSFLRIAGAGGAVFASRLARGADPYATSQDEFFFVQLSDTQPDFIVFTGDLTHTTDDPAERRRRLAGFKQNISRLKVREIRLMPGEHDASLDRGEAYKEFFGPTHYAFDHKGVHFIALDNVSDPAARIGDEQLAWLKTDLEKQPRDARIVVLTHRPLFPLYPQWDWATRDGDRAIELLMPHRNVTVFYGHIHQEHHYRTGHIEHHSAKSLIFPLPAPGSMPKREPIKWDPGQPYRGLGYREVEAEAEPVA